MISGSNKITFEDANSDSSKNTARKRSDLLLLNPLYTQLCCSGSSTLVCSWIWGLVRHSFSSWVRASCASNVRMLSLFWFPFFVHYRLKYWGSPGSWEYFVLIGTVGPVSNFLISTGVSLDPSTINQEWLFELSLVIQQEPEFIWRGLLFACTNLYVMLILHHYVI